MTRLRPLSCPLWAGSALTSQMQQIHAPCTNKYYTIQSSFLDLLDTKPNWCSTYQACWTRKDEGMCLRYCTENTFTCMMLVVHPPTQQDWHWSGRPWNLNLEIQQIIKSWKQLERRRDTFSGSITLTWCGIFGNRSLWHGLRWHVYFV